MHVLMKKKGTGSLKTEAVLLRSWDNPDTIDRSAEGDYFGSGVDATDTKLIVGAMYEDTEYVSNVGKVYFYDPLTLALEKTIENPLLSDSLFGKNVKINSTHYVVASNTNVHVFDLNTDELLYSISPPSSNDTNWGSIIAINDTRLVIGSKNNDVQASNAGMARVYDLMTGEMKAELFATGYPTRTNDYFGSSVSIGANIIAIGAPSEDRVDAGRAGAVYIYDLDGNYITTLQSPKTAGAAVNNYFGSSVAVGDTYIAVGSTGDTNAVGSQAGAVFVYNISNYSLYTTKLNPNIDTTSPQDNFGLYLTMVGSGSSSKVVVSASSERFGAYSGSGVCYIMNVTSSTVVTIQNPNAYGTHASDWFGQVLAANNNYVFNGVQYEDTVNSMLNTGVVYRSTMSGLSTTITNPNPLGSSAGDNFGTNIETDDTTGLYISSNESFINNTQRGKIFKYDNTTGGAPVEEWNTPDSTGHGFGSSMHYHNGAMIVGQPYGPNRGRAQLINTANGNVLHTFVNPREATEYNVTLWFGEDVSMNDQYIAISSGRDYDYIGSNIYGSGTVWIFDRSTYALVRTIPNPIPALYAYFGANIVLTASGQLAVSAVGVSGNSGVVYIIDPATGSVIRTFTNPDIQGTSSSDSFGYSIDFDGDILLVGAYNEDSATSTDVGAAYVFDATTGNLLHTFEYPTLGDASRMGHQVAIGGKFIAVSSITTSDVHPISGVVKIYDKTTYILKHTISYPGSAPREARFGQDIKFDPTNDNIVYITSLEGDLDGGYSGKAYMYEIP